MIAVGKTVFLFLRHIFKYVKEIKNGFIQQEQTDRDNIKCDVYLGW